MNNDWMYQPEPSTQQMGAWPDIQTSLRPPPAGGYPYHTMPQPMPDLGGNTGISGYGPGGVPFPGLGYGGPPRMRRPNDQRSSNVIDVNSIVERALQNILMGGSRG
jgi:hypothetical protein